MKYLFENVTAVTMERDNPVIKNAYLLVAEGRIAWLSDRRPDSTDAEIINGRNKVIMPGLINCHTHVPMTIFRGYAGGHDLQTWLFDYIFPAEDKLDARCISACSALGLAEMIMSGTTSISDMYDFCDEIADEVVAAGMKINLSRGITCFDERFVMVEHPKGMGTMGLFERQHMRAGGLVKVDASIHAEYTSNPSLWREIAAFASDKGTGIHLHLSETRKEHEECLGRYGKTPAQVFLESGVFDVPVTAAHAVWVSDRDIDILSERKVSVAHNPVSNLKLASGFAPVVKMKNAGVNVALGTDGVSSNNSHDMFEEIKQAAIIHNAVNMDATAITAFDALEMATVNGARAQGRENECGRLKPGMDADIIMLDFDRPHLTPCHDVIENIVFAARGSDVVMNMVRGRILYRDGQLLTIDLERVKSELDNYVIPKVMG